ncbi:MAG: alpha/beta fold hydrolase [Gallionella sp.]|nr:alpha/beta fold hydrolase [Gallionella sp.]
MSSWGKRLAATAGVLALLYASACAYMWATQMKQVFEPTSVLQTTPDRMGMKYDALRIPAGTGRDAGELEAWWVPADQPEAVTIVYFHGNYRNIGNNLEHTQRLHKLGYNVLLADYRGFGRSTGGEPREIKMYEDAEAVWQYLSAQRGGKPGKTFIYGHSLGGAVAINLALHHPEAAGLITESTFTSMQAMGELNYGFLPIGLLLSQRFESLKKMPRLKLPVLLIHGTWDKKVPVEMARELYAAAPTSARLLLIEGGEHNNSAAIGWVEYRDAVADFVRQNTR